MLYLILLILVVAVVIGYFIICPDKRTTDKEKNSSDFEDLF